MNIGFTNKNSPIHRLNPSLKFISFIVMIVMIFLPLGFFAQILIGCLILIVFFLSKLSKKTFWNIVKSFIFLFSILLLVNWVIYKTPIAVFVNTNRFAIQAGNMDWINTIGGISQVTENGTSFVSGLWGGNIIGFLDPINGVMINGQNYSFDDIANLNNFNNSLQAAQNLFNSLQQNSKYLLLQMCNNNEDLAIKYCWFLNNGFNIESQKFLIQVLSNTNNGFLNSTSAVIYQINWYTLSPEAIKLALYISIKVFLMILVTTILTATTTSVELSYALEDILSPLKIIRFPVVEASMIIAIALRFVPSLLTESQRILNAQSSRGVDFKNGNIKDKFKAIISLIVPLFNIAFIKSGELANAMEVRGYSTRATRTRYKTFKLNIVDWLFFALLCTLVGFMIGILIKPMIFTPFGIFELGMLI